MGLLDRLFKKDPAKVLDRAEALLADGSAYRALALVREVAAAGELAERVAQLDARCREALADKALEEARFMEEEGDFEDAAEWVRSALGQLGAEDERAPELRKRLKRLQARAREAEREWEMGGPIGRWLEEDDEDEGPDPLDLELRFGTLVGTLRDDVADRYLHRPLEFQQAYVDLNEGRLEEAEAAFDALVTEDPDDPVVRLERGRTRLLAGNAAGAREDFEVAWPALGDAPLDPAGALSVPTLWAEACLAEGDAGAVVDGLAGLAGFSGGAEGADDSEVAMVYARALSEAGRLVDAREYLVEVTPRFPGRHELPHLLADVLARIGETDRAVDVLEHAIAPSCASGSCSKPALHVPSVLLLVRLYLDRTSEDEAPPERVGELLALVAREQGGRATPEDLRLLARYQRASGLDEEAAETEATLGRLEEARPTEGRASDRVGDGEPAVSWSSGSKPVL